MARNDTELGCAHCGADISRNTHLHATLEFTGGSVLMNQAAKRMAQLAGVPFDLRLCLTCGKSAGAALATAQEES